MLVTTLGGCPYWTNIIASILARLSRSKFTGDTVLIEVILSVLDDGR